jgi:uncharacterized damage-inducible protein DinB
MAAHFAAHFNEVHAITCKAVRQVPEHRKDFRPLPEVFTIFDLAFHMFSQEKVMLIGCRKGKVLWKDFERVEDDRRGLGTIEDLVRYGEAIHQETSRWLAAASREDLEKAVETFCGPSTPEKLLASALEHILHHRGQLYVYLRLMGIEPVFVWTGEPMPLVREKLSAISRQQGAASPEEE